MRKCSRVTDAAAQQGIVLLSSLLLLLVVTIIALSMFRSFGLQEKIAGNLREKQRALHAAVSAQQYAEWWLSTSGNAATTPTVCGTAALDANLGQGQICSNVLSNPTTIPWSVGGVTYAPASTQTGFVNMNVSTTPGATTYYFAPTFYISDLGLSATGQGEIYKINAVGSGGTANAIAVVESTFSVSVSSWDISK